MKVKISEKKRVIKIKMSEKEWEEFTKSLLINAMDRGAAERKEAAAEVETAAEETPESSTTPTEEPETPKEKSPALAKPSRVENLFPRYKKPEPKKVMSKGVMFVECHHCGHKTFKFFSELSDGFYCDVCKEYSHFEQVKRIDYECKCGEKAYFYTDSDTLPKTLRCKSCQTIVEQERMKNGETEKRHE